ncbi:MAG: hypothetical protein WBL85_07010 [Sedimentisphaerales bacterium]
MPSKRKNIYTHSIDLKELRIENRPPREFAKCIEQIEYRGYEVEKLCDGRKIVIAKPGGKRPFGNIKKDDFLVFIFTPPDQLWQITHKQIYEDLEEKSKSNPNHAIKVLKALEEVYNGKELDDALIAQLNSGNQTGESPEALIRAYKWIWGQEDVNYPPPYDGRARCWKDIEELLKKLQK